MKKWIVLIIAIALLTGYSLADRGISPTTETQGIVTVTTLSGTGTFLSSSDLSMSLTDDSSGLDGIPPLGFSGGDGEIAIIIDGEGNLDGLTAQGYAAGATHYNAVYRETSYSNGLGVIQYTKILDADTSAATIGQSNIGASKQLTYIGGNTGRVFSDEAISVAGSATSDPMFWFSLGINTPAPPLSPGGCTRSMCGLLCSESSISPAYCNSAEAGSSVDMSTAHVTTGSSVRFITASDDTPVRLGHDIRVINSIGKASAGMDVLTMEGRPFGDTPFEYDDIWVPDQGPELPVYLQFAFGSRDLYQTTSFSESTRVDGAITIFDKSMVYESGMRR